MTGPLGDLAGLRWQDGVDVLVLTLVIYRLYAWLRGTVAVQIAVGMLTVVGASYVASLAGLVLTAYVLQGIGAVSILVGVVIFREEIRRALTKASPLRLLLRRRAAPERRDFTSVAEALFALAARRLGALVVVARRDSLADHVTGGTKLQAAISEPLIEALFQKTSPLHDGAVVVDGDRLTTAGAFLPLARTELPGRYGTRHSAAVGLSEVCDAIVIAVSEERGEVSLADGGTLAPVPDASALGRRLGELVGPMAAPAPRPRGTPVKDALVAAGIFCGVVAAWNVVANRGDATVERLVSVELDDLPAGLRLAPRPSDVAVRLRGPRRLLVKVSPGSIRVTAPVGAILKGAADVTVVVVAPPGVQIVEVTPPRVAVVEVRTVRVEPDLAGRRERVRRIEPGEVTLVARLGTLKSLTSIHTVPVTGSGTVGLAFPEGVHPHGPGDASVEVELEPLR